MNEVVPCDVAANLVIVDDVVTVSTELADLAHAEENFYGSLIQRAMISEQYALQRSANQDTTEAEGLIPVDPEPDVLLVTHDDVGTSTVLGTVSIWFLVEKEFI